MSSSAISEDTDKDDYLKNRNHRLCRMRKPGQRYGHQLPDWGKVPLTPVQGGDPRDPLSATHHMVMVCSRCGAKLVERWRIGGIVYDKKTKRYEAKTRVHLGNYWDYTGTEGYLYRGDDGRIKPSEAADAEMDERIATMTEFPGIEKPAKRASKPKGEPARKAAPRRTPQLVGAAL